MKKRILFMMADTGGGHRAAAQAISEATHYLYPDTYEILIEDIWEHQTLWPINKIPNFYPWASRSAALPVWELIWLKSKNFPIRNNVTLKIIKQMTTKTISYLRLLKPDIVVSVHPLMNHLGINWIKEANLEVPFVTIVTDMVTIHPLWICPSVTKCLVPTTQAQKSAVEFGMPKEKTEVCGHPVRRGFFTAVTDKNTLRQELGIEPTKPVVMIMGGGEGSGPIYETVHALAQIKPEIQMLVITGRNKRLKEKLAAITKKTSVRLYSFVQNIPELMYASDILITKAGPSTISEALVVGLPLIIFNHIPVQEIGNVTYLLENRAGVYAKDSFQIADLVQEYIYSIENSRLQQTVYNASKLSKPLASVTIANRICSLI